MRFKSEPSGKHREFAARLREAFSGVDKNQKQMAAIFRVSQAAISDWFNGKKMPSQDQLPKLAKMGKTTTDWLLTGKKKANSGLDENVDLTSIEDPSKLGKVPLVSYNVAGGWCDVEDPYSIYDGEKFIEQVAKHSGQAFALRIKGDSMWDGTPNGYPEGCIAQFDPNIEPRHRDDVVVRTPDNKTTFKQLHITPEGQFLVALNPDFPEKRIRVPEGTVIVGVCQGYRVEKGRR